MTPVQYDWIQSGEKPQEKQRKRQRRQTACNFCRTKKVRCDGDGRAPCANCVDRDLHQACVYPIRLYAREKSHSTEVSNIGSRLARLESILHQDSAIPCSILADNINNSAMELFNEASKAPRDRAKVASNTPRTISHPCERSLDTRAEASLGAGSALEFSGSIFKPTKPFGTPQITLSPLSVDSNIHMPSLEVAVCISNPNVIADDREEVQETSSICSNEISNWEYHGPVSYLSICSKLGVQWVINRTGCSYFQDSTRIFLSDITRRLKMQKELSMVRKTEPDAETAWKYTRAYFEESLDAALGIVDRSWFEIQLKSHYAGTLRSNNKAWHALRNVVFASGCRIELGKTLPYKETQNTAWAYFENALSVHLDLLYFQTTMLSVQALTLMAYYCQNLGSPCLEYMLCSNAFRLAVAKGFHRDPVNSWNLDADEVNQRRCIFWGIYCLEKQITCQSGRPSAINDEDIKCQLPCSGRKSSSINVIYCNSLIRISQLMSVAANSISKAQPFRMGGEAFGRTIVDLRSRADELRNSLESVIPLGQPINPSRLPTGLSLQQTVYLHYIYYNTLICIHAALACPWIEGLMRLSPHPSLYQQREESSQCMADICRDAILATEHVHFTASTPVPVLFFGPICSLINLFIFIIQNPRRSTAQSDLVLLDVGAGFFARIKFSTNAVVSIALAKELANIAHETVLAAQSQASCDDTIFDQIQDVRSSWKQNGGKSRVTPQTESPLSPMREETNLEDFLDIEIEDWSTFLPSDIDKGPYC